MSAVALAPSPTALLLSATQERDRSRSLSRGPHDRHQNRPVASRLADLGASDQCEDRWDAEDPDRMLMDFLTSAYEAAASTGKWDRPALETDIGVPGRPRAV